MRFQLLIPLCILVIFIWGCERPADVIVNNVPPATPSGVRISQAHDGGIFLEWIPNNEPDLKFYNVYRSINKTAFVLLVSTTDSYLIQDSLNYNDVYTYRVTAVDNQNLESAPSDTVSGMPKNLYPPDIPGRYSFLVQGRNWDNRKSVELSWEPNTDPDISHYNVYRDTVENFTADSTKYIGSTPLPLFSDTINILLYKKYFYKLKAVDNGGLLSPESHSESDMVFGVPELIFPANNSRINYFSDFIIKGISVPARYHISVQSNKYFGEIWSTDFSGSTNDTITVTFDPPSLDVNTTYYWRVAVYSDGKPDPNSVSDQYQFVIKP